MPVTTDFAGTETLAETKSRLGTLLTAYGYDSSGYSTWGDARTDLNSALTAIEETTISDGELASSFRSKLNALNAWSDYPAGGKVPNLVFDFEDEYYRANDTETTFGDSITFSRASSATYVDSDGVLQTAASGVPRIGHHVWNGSAWVNEGLLHESEARTNLLHTTDTLVTQSLTVTAVPHTLHFSGTGTVTLLGASTAGPLVGTGTGENNRVSLTFTPIAASLTLTVTGTVTNAQLEVGSTPSSYIPNLAASGSVTRAAETLTIPAANLPWPTPNVIGSEVWSGSWGVESGTGWAISGISATHTEATGSGAISKNLTVTPGVYRVSYSVAGNPVDGNASVNTSIQVFDDSTLRAGVANLLFGPEYTLFDGSTTYELIVVINSTTLKLRSFSDDDFEITGVSVREINPLSVSIQMDGRYTSASSSELVFLVRWYNDSDTRIQIYRETNNWFFYQRANAVTDTTSTSSAGSGVLYPYSVAQRSGSTFINGAVNGTALTENTTPTALPDLSTTDLSLGYDYMGTIRTFRMWDQDIGDSGIEEASA